MKSSIVQALEQSINCLDAENIIAKDFFSIITLESTKNKDYGDYASNVALVLAKSGNLNPKDLAALIIQRLPLPDCVEKVEIAGPGFINFTVKKQAQALVVKKILDNPLAFGASNMGSNRSILLEFVSANPTGPLHVGHGRGAAFGASLANILIKAGFKVTKEYYVNDAGRQMNILTLSVWLRYTELLGNPVTFPQNGYKGAYVTTVAQQLLNQYAQKFDKNLPGIITQGDDFDPEKTVDILIEKLKNDLGKEDYSLIHAFVTKAVLDDIKNDLSEFGVMFDQWFSEQSLIDKQAHHQAIESLKKSGHCYIKENALWFKSQILGDEKDRVLIRANQQTTYFASDVAYHWDKYQRGFDEVINIFGADHHGYVSRIKSAVKALGHNPQALKIILVQFAILYRGNERLQMSTRSGSFVTLRQLREEVGNDAARFFYVLRKPEQHMDFDLELAKSQSNDNPVYYIQYAYARICSVLRQLVERSLIFDELKGLEALNQLLHPNEALLLGLLNNFPVVIEKAASNCEPHQLAYYLRDLAHALHSYYNAIPLLTSEEHLRNARLCLIKAVACILKEGLSLLGVSSPETM